MDMVERLLLDRVNVLRDGTAVRTRIETPLTIETHLTDTRPPFGYATAMRAESTAHILSL
jgi:hypothetical protein